MLCNGFQVLGVSAPGKELQDVKNEEGIIVVPLNMTRTISPLRDIKSLWDFYRLCKKQKPLIVHSHTPKAGIVGMLGAKLAGVPIRMHTVAGMPLMEATGLKRRLLNIVEKITYAAATRIYPNSTGLYAFIVRHQYAPVNKLKVIANGSSNGIDTAFFSPDLYSDLQKIELHNKLSLGSNNFIFIFVGRLVGDKGINELISAFKQLNGTSAQQVSKLLLVGPFETALDPLKQETLDEIDRNPNILSLGYQPDVRPYLAVSDALVFPSYREGFPNVVMQAGAMGLPAIVTDINGCNEIIEEGKNGTIIPPKDAEALQKAMERMMADPAWRRGLKENARPMIAARYEQQIVWEALLAEYQTLINQWSSSDRN
ncbi:glycosyltransferase family 1 protein [Chryseobacterium sp. 6424]|nr:glycosyltransferase family 1 protein [Chryseobacterium sp. 6424]